ncbi:GNAT family N-acetyltransferase [Ideonella sp. YS5]|uniref:GNAT family N-acetyltransferase n=1 Tax=Ideonella sp. YS5 TaxID=3453714 RepID=UPI003EEC9109
MLSSGRYTFRPFTDADIFTFVDAVRESGHTVGRWMSWAHEGYRPADAAAWFAHCDEERASGASHEFGIFDTASGTLVGGCGLNQFNTANGFCNLGYWVRQSWQRRGAALAAVEALAPLAFGELGQGRVEIVVAQGNLPSLGVAERAGAVRECLARNRLKLHGRFVDAWVFSIIPPGA